MRWYGTDKVSRGEIINGAVQTHNRGTVPRHHQRQLLSKHFYHNHQWCLLHSHMVQTLVSLAQQKSVEMGC